MRVYLVGYMGTGKSHLGKMLADHLGYQFLDTDCMIEERTGKTIPEIFEEEGEERFRELEREQIHTVNEDNVIISCGGGLPCFYDNMEYILSHGKVIWIKSSVKDIIARIIDGNDRPMIKDKKERLTSYVKEHLKSRKPYYEKSHIKVWNRGPETGTVNRMVTYLRYLDSVMN